MGLLQVGVSHSELRGSTVRSGERRDRQRSVLHPRSFKLWLLCARLVDMLILG